MTGDENFVIPIVEIKKMIDNKKKMNDNKIKEQNEKEKKEIYEDSLEIVTKLKYLIKKKFIGEIFIDDIGRSRIAQFFSVNHKSYDYRDSVLRDFINIISKEENLIKIDYGYVQYNQYINQIRCSIHNDRYSIKLQYF